MGDRINNSWHESVNRCPETNAEPISLIDLSNAVRCALIILFLSSSGCLAHYNEIVKPSGQKPVPALQNNTTSAVPIKKDPKKPIKSITPEKSQNPEKAQPSPYHNGPPPPPDDDDRPIPCDELDLDEDGSCIEV